MREPILPHPRHKANLSEPDITGILHDEQLLDIGLIKISLFKIKELIDAVNSLASDNDLSVRQIPDTPLALVHNDLSKIVYAHVQAEKRIRAAAFAAVEMATA